MSTQEREVPIVVSAEGLVRRAVATIATLSLIAAVAPATAAAVDDHTLYLGGSFATNIFPGTSNGPGLAGINIRDGGSLGSIAGSPFGPAGIPAEQVAITPDDEFLYVSSAGTQQVLAFSVGNRGVLTSTPGITFTGGDPDPSVIAIAPDGNHAYVADPGPEGVRILAIADDGTLTDQGLALISGVTNTYGVAITPDGNRLYATAINAGQSRVYGFTVGVDGGLTALPGTGTPISGPLGTATISITPDGIHLYTASRGGSVNGFTIAVDGSLIATTGSPYGSGFSGALAASPAGGRLYATRSDSPGPSGVASFTIAVNGALTAVAGSPFTAPQPTDTIAVPPDDRFVYTAGGGPTALTSGFAVGAGGVLSLSPGASIVPGPYFASPGSSTVSPNQPPVADVSISRGGGAGVIAFDGTGSTDADGETAGWVFDFGDASFAVGASGPPLAANAYAVGQVYQASLTMTDDEGCSTKLVFTGQTASCNGGPIAKANVEVDLVQPDLDVSAKRKQGLRKAVTVKLSCAGGCEVDAGGRIVADPKRLLGKRLNLKPKTFSATAVPEKLRVKLSKRGRKAAESALDRGAELKAKVKFSPSKPLVDGTTVRRKVAVRP